MTTLDVAADEAVASTAGSSESSVDRRTRGESGGPSNQRHFDPTSFGDADARRRRAVRNRVVAIDQLFAEAEFMG